MNKTIEVDEDQLKELTIKLCQLGEEMGIEPDQFAVMLGMSARYLQEAQGIELKSERVLHG